MNYSVLSYIDNLKEYKTIEDCVSNNKSCCVFGVDNQKMYFTARICATTSKKLFIVVPDEKQARMVYEFMNQTCGKVFSFPAKDYNFRDIDSVSRFDENKRIEALSHIRKKDFNAIIITAAALTTLIMSPDEYKEITIHLNSKINFNSIEKILTDYGYQRFPIVEGIGQYSIRGSIIDIFPPSNDKPYRIEFFGDEIDSISFFDPVTQRRDEPIDTVKITPAVEYSNLINEKLKNFFSTHKNNEHIQNDIELLNNGILPKHDRYLPLYFEKQSCILDYIDNDISLVFFDYYSCKESIESCIFRINEDIKSLISEGFIFTKKDYYFSIPLIIEKSHNPIIFETLPRSINDFSISHIADIKLFTSSSPTSLALKEEIDRLSSEDYQIIICTASEQHTLSLKKEYENYNKLIITQYQLPYGFILPDIKIAVYAFAQKGNLSRPKKFKKDKGEKIKNFSDINIGDYVVHENYGIGIYDGIHKVESQGVINDYIKLKFAGTDVLYFPCSQLDQISKYIGSSNNLHVKLNKLGGTDWTNTKKKIKKAVSDLAKQLTALYGERLKLKGFSFSPDTDWQKDFENKFEFEETEDQLKSIKEIKKDMESSIPMDRLLCGDVGFGKTEVALRAVFKCVSDGKQVALLTPTTILSYQHYQTMLHRFSDYPVQIELLSRYRTTSQQSRIINELKSGRIDVLVGTHRILQKDIIFKDLGLIIVDEEQRFGVSHKEHLKEIAKNADILTLSATPIPRTLNMAMSGIRDISVLNEAPNNRYPVTTYVAEFDQGLVIDAIKREVSRGGQCFYLHNRIESIYKKASEIYEKTGYRIQVAHGKMSQEDLSLIWENLIKGEIDILVCTTIIETGVDVPNCNTLIVEDADKMGLAQLHQIRGRVGRSDRRAYAYFTYRKGKTLSPEAYKRLMTIREYTEFGSGLKIAMRDLEIRGAGNILGAEQSGHLSTVGFDMYMKMLEQAVNQEKGLPETALNCTVDIKLNAYIPDSYIVDTDTRIEIYKLIASITDQKDIYDVTDELIDRFGDPPKPVLTLINIAKIKSLAAFLNISKIENTDNELLFYFETAPQWDVISDITKMYPHKLFFSMGSMPYFTLKSTDFEYDADQFLNKLSSCIDNYKK